MSKSKIAKKQRKLYEYYQQMRLWNLYQSMLHGGNQPTPHRPGGNTPNRIPRNREKTEDLNDRFGGVRSSSDPIRNFKFIVRITPVVPGGWTEKGEHDGIFDALIGFTSISGIGVQMVSMPYNEGGLNTYVHQIPGTASYSPIVLQRGVTLGGDQHWKWMKRMLSTVGAGGYGAGGTNFRCHVKIHVLGSPNPGSRTSRGGGDDGSLGFGDRIPSVKFPGENRGALASEARATLNDPRAITIRLHRAWITSLTYSDLNAGDSALLVEQMTLVHQGMNMKWHQNYKQSDNNNSDDNED